MPESREHRPDSSGVGAGEKTPDSPGVAKPDPNELVMLNGPVLWLFQRRSSKGQVGPTVCLKIPEITTRRVAEDLIRGGLVPPGYTTLLDPPTPSDIG